MENNLTTDEKELLSLVQYHRRSYEEAKLRQGGLHPDDIEIVKLLDKAYEFVQNISDDRKKRKAKELRPVLTVCPRCEVQKVRKPISEEKNEHGYMCNRFLCDECKTNYLDYHPNNAKDQLNWLEELIAVFDESEEKLKNAPDEIKKDILALKKQRDEFKKIAMEEEKALAVLKQAEQKQAEGIAKWRDYLLAAKINRQWGNSHIGES